jgi:ferritin-like metal-binding protein YciE
MGEAMCGIVAVRLIKLKQLSTKQRNDLKKRLQRRHKEVKAQLNDLERALEAVSKKAVSKKR